MFLQFPSPKEFAGDVPLRLCAGVAGQCIILEVYI